MRSSGSVSVKMPASSKARLMRLMQQGKFGDADKLCARLCKSHPGDAETWFLQAVISGQLGKFPDAEEYCLRSLKLFPGNPVVLFNLGVARQRLGKPGLAEESFRRAVELKADFAPAWLELGNTIQAQGRAEEAIAAYGRCLAINPGMAEAHYNLGRLLESRGESARAMASFQSAVRYRPDMPDAHFRLGNLCYAAGDFDTAATCYQRVLQLDGNHVQAANNLGNAHKAAGRADEAVDAYRRAVKGRPDYIEAYNNLGNALLDMGNVDDALEALGTAARLRPGVPEVCFNLGRALQAAGRLGEAEKNYRQSLAGKPIARAANNLGNLLVSEGRIGEALEAYSRAFEIDPGYKESFSNFLFCLNYSLDHADSIFRSHLEWGERYCGGSSGAFERADACAGRKLRVGYVSADFKEHSVAFFLQTLFSGHDRERFEIACYANLTREDALTSRFRSLSDHWVDISRMDDAQAAARIREDRVDILVDLAGHTSGNRLGVFCLRPAPVQVTYLGYPNTTGVPAIDYRLTDGIADPEDSAERFSETLVRLPGCFLAYTPPAEAADIPVSEPPAAGRGYVTFGSFNNLAKVNEDVVRLWSEVLASVPGSCLVLKNRAFSDEGTRSRYDRQFEAAGIDPGRVEYISWSDSIKDHLSLYGKVDIALDTFPYNGTTTTCEALWMGVPVITFSGENHAGRVSASLLAAAGLSSCVGKDRNDYRRIAVEMASDVAALSELRASLRPSLLASTLCDGNRLAGEIEQAYRQMWRKWCEES